MDAGLDDAQKLRVLAIFRSRVKRPLRRAVRPEAELYADLDMDSLSVLSALLAVEQELGLALAWDSPLTGEVRTVADIIVFVARSRAAGPAISPSAA
jgi:acyl carrier protein